jgi:hypothetical protein
MTSETSFIASIIQFWSTFWVKVLLIPNFFEDFVLPNGILLKEHNRSWMSVDYCIGCLKCMYITRRLEFNDLREGWEHIVLQLFSTKIKS